MSWQGYIDNLIAGGHIASAAIIGYPDGQIWAASPGFNVSISGRRGLLPPPPPLSTSLSQRSEWPAIPGWVKNLTQNHSAGPENAEHQLLFVATMKAGCWRLLCCGMRGIDWEWQWLDTLWHGCIIEGEAVAGLVGAAAAASRFMSPPLGIVLAHKATQPGLFYSYIIRATIVRQVFEAGRIWNIWCLILTSGLWRYCSRTRGQRLDGSQESCQWIYVLDVSLP